MILRHCSRQTQRGFTLTELAIVLGVIGTILGSIWAASAHVHRANKIEKADADIMAVLNNYRGLYAQHGIDVGGASQVDVTCIGVNANFFPADMANGTCATGTTSTYPIGSFTNSNVEVLADPTTANNGIVIEYLNLTQDACNNFTAATTVSPDIVSTYINGVSVGTAPTVTAIEAQCGTGTNTVAITYKAR